MRKNSNNIPDDVRQYLAEIGRKGGSKSRREPQPKCPVCCRYMGKHGCKCNQKQREVWQ
jgi:general stress protein YciG